MKLLSPRLHGYVDYAVVALLVVVPLALGFDPVPASICYVTAVAQLVVSLLADHPLGAARKIPFPVHGALEVSLGAALLAAPWMLRFPADGPERPFFIASGIVLMLLALATRYTAAVISRPQPYDRYDR